MSDFFKKGYRPFWTAFLLSLLVLGSALAVCCSMVFSVMEEQPVDTSPSIPVGVGEDFNLLLIGCREKNQDPQRVVLIRFDPLDSQAHIQNVDLTQTATVKLHTDTLAGPVPLRRPRPAGTGFPKDCWGSLWTAGCGWTKPAFAKSPSSFPWRKFPWPRR